MGRPKLPRKELEALLKEAEGKGPSDPNYERNLRGLLLRETCWEARS